jgi:hypothetical protein
MCWILLIVAVIGFSLGFSAKSAGLMGLGIVVGMFCLVGSFFGFAAARIESTARPDIAIMSPKDLQSLRGGAPPKRPAPLTQDKSGA